MRHMPGHLQGVIGREGVKTFQHAMTKMPPEGVILTTHDVPDADGLGSAFALQRYLRATGIPAEIVVCRLIPTTGPFIDHMGMTLRRWTDIAPEDDRPVIVLDTNTPTLMNGHLPKRPPLLVIDHHQISGPTLNARYEVVSVDAISACELAAAVMPYQEIDKQMSLALAVGISSDSCRLAFTKPATLGVFSWLLKHSDAPRALIDSLAYPSAAPDATINVMRELGGAQTFVYKDKVLAVGRTKLDPAAILASAMRDIGATVGIALREMDDGFKISIWVKLYDAYQLSIHANDIARRASQLCNMPEEMWGGGHIDKAGAFIRGTYESVSSTVVDAAREIIDNSTRSN